MRSWTTLLACLAFCGAASAGERGDGPEECREPQLAGPDGAPTEAQDRATIERFARGHPDRRAWTERMLAEPPRDLPGVTVLPNGEVLVGGLDPNGASVARPAGSHTARLAALAESISVTPSRSNQLQLYRSHYQALSATLPSDQFERLRLAPPETVARQPTGAISQANDQIAAQWATIAVSRGFNAPPPPLDCGAEVGANTSLSPWQYAYGDAAPSSLGKSYCRAAPAPDGLFENFPFPLRRFLGCVRNQGNRGTCHSFATVAAVETLIARDHGQAVNLSEQDLMAHTRLLWYPNDYVDSASAWSEISAAAKAGYRFAWESQWDYDPSWARVISGGNMADTCAGYPQAESCSDSSHQARRSCPAGQKCSYALPEIGAPSGFSIDASAAHQLWDPARPAASLQTLLVTLAARTPVALTLGITPYFQGVGSSGYVLYNPRDLYWPVGAHVMEAVGVVKNEDGAVLVPNFVPGSGGGYVLVKNSWGTCYGDGGYAYLPFDYVSGTAVQAVAVTAVKLN